MEKWFAFVLFLIVAAGTFVPCCGVDECCADQLPASANHDKHKSEGACAPFFACATCPGSVELTNSIHLVFPKVEKTVHHQARLTFNLSTYSPSFWQPPRFC